MAGVSPILVMQIMRGGYTPAGPPQSPLGNWYLALLITVAIVFCLALPLALINH